MIRALCFTVFLICNAANAQSPVGFGIKGGFSITDSFSPGGDPPNVFSQSVTKDYIVGPTVEFRLPLGLSLEADLLYRPASLELQAVVVTNPTTNPTLSTTPWMKQHVNTLEFPALVKYRLPVFRLKPVLEAGPSFRAGGSSYSLTHYGFTCWRRARIQDSFCSTIDRPSLYEMGRFIFLRRSDPQQQPSRTALRRLILIDDTTKRL